MTMKCMFNCVCLQASGHMVSLTILDRLGLSECKKRLVELCKQFREIKVDKNEYTCLRFLILLNSGEFNIILLFIFYLSAKFLSQVYCRCLRRPSHLSVCPSIQILFGPVFRNYISQILHILRHIN